MKHLRITQLDGLRGLFAIMLIFYHFPLEGEFAGMFLTSNCIARQCDLFVDFFFVLSGFVISFNYEEKIKSFSDFTTYLTHRFLRLYPLLLYTVLVFLGFELFINLIMPELVNTPESVGNLLIQTLNSLLFLNSTPLLDRSASMNHPSWSISAEMISYIVFGLSVLLFRKRRKLVLGIILLASAAFLISVNTYLHAHIYGFARCLICFITGYFTFLAYKRFMNTTINAAWEYIMSILLIVIFYIRFYHIEDKNITTLYIIPPFFGISIFVYALSNGYIMKIMSGKVFQFLGKISYSIYLNHVIVIVVISKLSFSVLKIPVNEITVSSVLALCVIVVIFYSYLTYNIIEKKGRTFLQSLLPKKETEEQKPIPNLN